MESVPSLGKYAAKSLASCGLDWVLGPGDRQLVERATDVLAEDLRICSESESSQNHIKGEW